MQTHRVPRMVLAPSRCFFCQRADGPAIDTGIQHRAPIGRVYICETSCAGDIVVALGGYTPAMVKAKGEELETALGQRDELEAEVKRLEPFERAIAKARETVDLLG